MIQIEYTMSNGEKVTQSRCSFDEGQLYQDSVTARIDMERALEKLAYFTADNGVVIVCAHIATARIIGAPERDSVSSDPDSSAAASTVGGESVTCASCGRKLPPGMMWCPQCNKE